MSQKTDGPKSEKLLNVKEIEEATGLSKAFILKAKKSYGLPHYKMGSSIRFRLSEVLLWIEERRVN